MTARTRSAPARLVSVANLLGRHASRAAGGSQAAAVWHTLIELQRIQPQRLGDLAVAVRVTQPTMTGIVSRLEELGWLQRVRDKRDGRVWLIEGTPAGFDALSTWGARIDAILDPLFSDLHDDERAALAKAVEIIEGRLRRLESSHPSRELKEVTAE
ncbi:MarR family winged helix-turn-helix transcriptional regulator [Agreia sp. COWG]|uniref:MarR family winged helix-turn-helix transcriptional regulator n=1 Tax=Agreia sp. COWG TaxID=2773266 RepID=UPI001925230B|nr:MarR family transcriptional regulator [Agreia sp. COWG]CAD6006989.1 exported protein of unknown function [Agreia sp. COWG]